MTYITVMEIRPKLKSSAIVQVPGPKKWLILGVSLTRLVERQRPIFLEAEIVDNIFQRDVPKNMRQKKVMIPWFRP